MSENPTGGTRKRLLRKILVTVVVLVIGLFSVTSAFEKYVGKYLFGSLSEKTNTYLTDTMIKAGASYATLRTGNAIVSIIQDTEIGIPGTGTAVAAGEILDPINDILERTSAVMMLSLTSLGIQKIIFMLSSWISMTVLLSLAMLLVLIETWAPERFMGGACKILAVKLLLVALLVYLFVPFAYYANNKIYYRFMDDTYQASVAGIENFNTKLKQIQESREEVEEGFWDKFNIKAKLQEIKQKFSDLQDRAAYLVSGLIDLAVVFILQTVVIPLLFLWLLVKLIGAIFRSDAPGHFFAGGYRKILHKGG